MSTLLLTCGLIALANSIGWFIISLIVKRNDVADIGWGAGFFLIAMYLWITQPSNNHAVIVYAAVCVWALRLSLHIGYRNALKTEDFRYKAWRDEWGKNFFLRSFLQVYLLQGFLLFIIASPLIIAAAAPHYFPGAFWSHLLQPFIKTFTAIGFSLWLIGFLFESISDYQLAVFKKTKKTGDIIQTGLWKYSRHPNYFGEICLWWGIFFMVLPLPFGIFAIISPVLISFLLLWVSGIPMLEAKYEGQTAFETYKAKTNALIPWFPKKIT